MRTIVMRVIVPAMLLLLCTACAVTPPDASSLASPSSSESAPEGTLSLLEGRLYIKAPAGTVSEPVYPNGVMGAAAAPDKQTRLVYTEGKEQLAFDVYENFMLSSGTLAEDIPLVLTEEAAKTYELLPLADGDLVAILAAKEDLAMGENAFHLFSAFSKAGDGGLISLSVSVSGVTAERLPYYRTMAEEALRSITLGKREMSVEKRDLPLRADETTPLVTVDGGFASSTSKGPDFDVTYVTNVVKFSEQQSVMGIYIGENPTAQGENTGVAPTEVPGSILGKAVTWKEYRKGSMILAEVIVPYNSTALQMHVFIQTGDEEVLTKLHAMSTTIREGE